jgi:hypothetical protein
MKHLFSLLLSLVLLVAPAMGAESGKDSVKIIEVATAPAAKGAGLAYTVRVRYTLASLPRGKVMLGLAAGPSKSFRMLAGASVAQGQGEVELTADFAAPAGSPVTVYANISPDPHGKTWQPLASDTKALGP